MNTESVSRWCLSTIVNGATQILMASDTCSTWLVDAAGRANEVVFRDAFNRVVNVSFRKYDTTLAAPTTPPMSEAAAAPVIDLEAQQQAAGGDDKMTLILKALQQQSCTINGQS